MFSLQQITTIIKQEVINNYLLFCFSKEAISRSVKGYLQAG